MSEHAALPSLIERRYRKQPLMRELNGVVIVLDQTNIKCGDEVLDGEEECIPAKAGPEQGRRRVRTGADIDKRTNEDALGIQRKSRDVSVKLFPGLGHEQILL